MALLLGAALLAAGACSTTDEEAEPSVATTEEELSLEVDVEPAETPLAGDEAARPEVDCSAEGLDDTGEFAFESAHYVVDGRLGALCFGEEDSTLANAWQILADIVPQAQLADLALFAGFGGDVSQEEPTLAFVNARDDTDEFQMSVNLTEAEAFPQQFELTMVHEFAHVLTGGPTQLDRTLAAEDCTTWDNGDGCYLPGSLMDEWTSEFWSSELDSLDPGAEPDSEQGQARCDADPGFLGSYAASHPEEDFAESFAAFVLRVQLTDPAQQERYAFLERQPGLVEFRQQAEATGYGPAANEFDQCGLGT